MTAAATDVVVRTTASHALSAAGEVRTPIVKLNLVAGKWVLSASGDIVNFGPSDYTRCEIVVRARQVAAVSTIVGKPAGTGNQGAAGYLSPVSLQGGVALTSTTTAVLRCWHDHTTGASSFDPSVTLYAHGTSSLQMAAR